ncbi:TPA: hypothetical protein LY620_001711 [Enterococcus faecium]|uniref:hypothetical protein n=2 Tax=Enterococcus faecium TaxID=1352 RepID=UPI00248BFF03|nr:hypothetical protein [Enterococcus faecium]HBM6063348.1 hypothetical protein [Enterococcus faecium]
MKKRQKIKKEILGKSRMIQVFLSYFNKLKTFFLPEKAESNELTASDRSAFSLLSLIFEAKRLKNNLIDGVQKSVSRY